MKRRRTHVGSEKGHLDRRGIGSHATPFSSLCRDYRRETEEVDRKRTERKQTVHRKGGARKIRVFTDSDGCERSLLFLRIQIETPPDATPKANMLRY